jgi:hypothetical protein
MWDFGARQIWEDGVSLYRDGLRSEDERRQFDAAVAGIRKKIDQKTNSDMEALREQVTAYESENRPILSFCYQEKHYNAILTVPQGLTPEEYAAIKKEYRPRLLVCSTPTAVQMNP